MHVGVGLRKFCVRLSLTHLVVSMHSFCLNVTFMSTCGGN